MDDELADRIGRELQERAETLAVAESLTGGMLAQQFAKASESSKWFQGGLVAYSRTVKHRLLEVPAGPVVSEQSAVSMARGVAGLMDASVAVALTGVGGPQEQDGQPPGTVWLATWPPGLGEAVLLRIAGEPPTICEQACVRAVEILAARLGISA
jgi:nicotinamide-nucleotide amidase